MEQSNRYKFPKKLIVGALLIGSLSFVVVPVMARHHHGFTGGDVHDALKIAQEVLVSSQKLQEYQKQVEKYVLLAQKFCALTGLKVPGVLNTLDKYSNATAQFKGKTVSSLSELPQTDIEIMKEAGQFDLHTYAGLRAYEKYLKEKYQLNDLEALTLIHQYMADENIKEYYLHEAIVMPIARKIDGVSSAEGAEVGSKVAVQQQSNIVSHVRGRSEIDGARRELVEKSNELEREQIEHQEDQAVAGLGSIRTTISFDPYHMNETEKKLWNEQNTPDVVDLTFDGKKHDK